MKRRSLLALPAAILPSVAPFRVHATARSSQSRPLTVSAFGGVFQEAFTSYVANKFTEETGIPVSVVSQSLDDTWVFGIANAVRNGLAPVDLTILTRSQIMRLERIGGMLQPFSRARLNNLTWLQDRYITEGDSGITGIGTMAWFINLVTNTSATAGQPVDSWREVFESPEYNNRIGLQGFYNGGLLETLANVYLDGNSSLDTDEGLQEVFALLRKIKPRIKLWWTGESQMEQGLRSGDIVTGMYPHDVALLLEEKGLPVKSVFPQECAFMGVGYFACPATSPHLKHAEHFVDFCLKPEIQMAYARRMKLSPVLPFKDLGLSQMEYEKVSTLGKVVTPASRVMVERASDMQKMWQRALTR